MKRSFLILSFACWILLWIAGTAVAAKKSAAPVVSDGGPLVRVALYHGPGTGGNGPPNLLKHLNRPPQFAVTRITPEQIRGGTLTNYDVVVFAGGSAGKQAASIGPEGLAEVRRFVENGGGYIGICAGAYLATCGSPETRLGLLDAVTVSPKWERGKGRVELELTEAGRRIVGHPAGRFPVLYVNGPVVKPAGREDLPDYETLAWFRTELAKNGTPAGIMVNSPAVFAGTFGRGRAVCVSPHPEQTDGLEHIIPRLAAWAARRGAQAGVLSPARRASFPGRIGAYVTFSDRQTESPEQLRALMAELKSSGVDFIIPFMAKHTSGQVNWDSRVAPKELIGNRNYLGVIIPAAHAAGLKVHPAVGMATEGGENGPNALLKKHPSWAFRYNGKAQGYIDPGNPGARRYEIALVTEMVSKYDVDGLSLDYMRCPNRVGWTESGRKHFLEKHGVDLAKLTEGGADAALDTEGGRTAARQAAASAREHPVWPEWKAWRREQLNTFMEELRTSVHNAKPGLPISSYVWGARTYSGNYETCQDWKTWIETGRLDWINPSGYRYTDAEFLEAVQANRALIPKDFPYLITIGVATSHGKLNGADDVIRYLKIAAENGVDGIVFFRWNSLQPFLPQVAPWLRSWPQPPS